MKEDKVKLINSLKKRAKELKCEVITIYYAYQNPNVGKIPKIIILITLGYALSPIDLIPDFIPVIGLIDDLIIIPVLISLSIKLIPEDIINQSREKSKKEPIELKKNWYVAVFFILLWTILSVMIILKLLDILYVK